MDPAAEGPVDPEATIAGVGAVAVDAVARVAAEAKDLNA